MAAHKTSQENRHRKRVMDRPGEGVNGDKDLLKGDRETPKGDGNASKVEEKVLKFDGDALK